MFANLLRRVPSRDAESLLCLEAGLRRRMLTQYPGEERGHHTRATEDISIPEYCRSSGIHRQRLC